MEATTLTVVLFLGNIVFALLAWFSKRAVSEQDKKMSAIVTSLDEFRNKLHLLEVELPRTYATKQELLHAQTQTTETLKSIQKDMTQVLLALGVNSRAA